MKGTCSVDSPYANVDSDPPPVEGRQNGPEQPVNESQEEGLLASKTKGLKCWSWGPQRCTYSSHT